MYFPPPLPPPGGVGFTQLGKEVVPGDTPCDITKGYCGHLLEDGLFSVVGSALTSYRLVAFLKKNWTRVK